jgi:hypothetical protein
MRCAFGRHDAILHGAVTGNGGVIVSTMGDGISAVFASAVDALAAALDAQQHLALEPWGAVASTGLPPDAELLDLGLHQLRDLTEPMHVYQLVHPTLTSDFPPLRSLNAVPGNLPRQLTSFVGRERELRALRALVAERPLVTLTGVGGVGKTRLAVQLAAELAPQYPDGAWLCELAAVVDPDAVWPAVATSLGVPPGPGRPHDEPVIEFLGPKRLLLLLDNCEHLLSSCARAADAIVQHCPDVTILATSREGLAIRVSRSSPSLRSRCPIARHRATHS